MAIVSQLSKSLHDTTALQLTDIRVDGGRACDVKDGTRTSSGALYYIEVKPEVGTEGS